MTCLRVSSPYHYSSKSKSSYCMFSSNVGHKCLSHISSDCVVLHNVFTFKAWHVRSQLMFELTYMCQWLQHKLTHVLSDPMPCSYWSRYWLVAWLCMSIVNIGKWARLLMSVQSCFGSFSTVDYFLISSLIIRCLLLQKIMSRLVLCFQYSFHVMFGDAYTKTFCCIYFVL